MLCKEIKMTDQELKDLVASLAIAQKETDRKLKSIGLQLGNMSKNQGYCIRSVGSGLKVYF